MNEKDKKEGTIDASAFNFEIQDNKNDKKEAETKIVQPTKFASISEKLEQNAKK